MDKIDHYGDKGGLVTTSYFDEDLEVFLKKMILIMTLRGVVLKGLCSGLAWIQSHFIR